MFDALNYIAQDDHAEKITAALTVMFYGNDQAVSLDQRKLLAKKLFCQMARNLALALENAHLPLPAAYLALKDDLVLNMFTLTP